MSIITKDGRTGGMIKIQRKAQMETKRIHRINSKVKLKLTFSNDYISVKWIKSPN